MTKRNLERKGFILNTLPCNSPSLSQVVAETQKGKNLEAGVAAGATEEYFLLTCYSWIAQPAFLEDHHLRTGTTHKGPRPYHIDH